MTIEFAAAAALSHAPQAAAGGAPVQVGYGVSLTDLGGFQRALDGASARLEARPVAPTSEAAKQLLAPFEQINGEAQSIATEARAARDGGREMTPGEIVMLTVRCQEFSFHCMLTSNIANRTSDGLQQLFRQQA